MDFYINCYIPSLKKNIKINKLCFGDFYQCNLYIDSKDYDNLNETFEKICEKSCSNYKNLNNLDKFSILLHLYCFYLNFILKLSAKNIEDEPITYEVFLKSIINEIKKYNLDNFELPKKLYYSNVSDILNECKKTPNDIKIHINQNKILMFQVPEMVKGVPKIYMNCFDNSLFHFIKLLYSENINYLFKKIKTLKKDLNFTLNEIYETTPKELDLFLTTK